MKAGDSNEYLARSDLSDEFSGSSLNTKKWRPIWGPEWVSLSLFFTKPQSNYLQPGRAPSQFSRATKRDPDFTYSKLVIALVFPVF